MTLQIAIDPGLNTGIALAHYDDRTPYQLLDRWQVHDGLEGFLAWQDFIIGRRRDIDEFVLEKFILANNDFAADISGVPIEGVIARWARDAGAAVFWQTRADKGLLTGYPPDAKTKAQRQRVRFDFLQVHGLFAAGTENDDSNDAVTHGLVNLKKRRHLPTLRQFWPPRKDGA